MKVAHVKSYVTTLLNNKFVKNVLLVAGGTAGAQAIAMALVPLITRIYGPEIFGLQGIFVAMLAVITPIAALTYPIAIVLPKKDPDAINLAKLSLLIALITSSIAGGIVFFFGDVLVMVFNAEVMRSFLWLLPISMFLSALQQVMSQWLIRKKEYKGLSQATLLQAIMINLSKVAIGLAYPIAIILITVSALANGIYAFFLWFSSKTVFKRSSDLISNQTNSNFKLIAKQYSDFAIYRTPQVFINALSQSLPVLLLAAFFGPMSAGFYTLGKVVMGIPSSLIGKSVADVFYPKITEASHAQKSLLPILKKATFAMAVVGFIPFAVVGFYGPEMFSFVFGEEWLQAGVYARWLSIWLFFGFLNRPSVAAIATLGLQKFFLFFECLSILFRVIALYVGFVIFKSDLIAVILFSLVGTLLNIYLVLKTFLYSKRSRE